MKTGRVLGQYCFSFEKWPAFKGGQVKQLLTAYLGSQTQLRQKEHKKKRTGHFACQDMSCVAVQMPVPLPKQSTNLHFHAFRSFCDAITILAVCQNPLETRSESTLEILSRAQPRAAELRNTIGFTHHSFFFFFSASQLYGYCAFTSDNGFRTSFSH